MQRIQGILLLECFDKCLKKRKLLVEREDDLLPLLSSLVSLEVDQSRFTRILSGSDDSSSALARITYAVMHFRASVSISRSRDVEKF